MSIKGDNTISAEIANNGSVEFREGDVVFLAGNPRYDGPIKWEHVAIVAEGRVVKAMEEISHLLIWGLPESDTEDGYAMTTVRGLYLEDFSKTESGSERPLGHPESGWNIVGRVTAIDHIELEGAMEAFTSRMFEFKWGPYFEPTMANGVRKVNCLGYVCYFFRDVLGCQLLHPKFDFQYNPGYAESRLRDYPAPGHLVRAILSADYPWGQNENQDGVAATAMAKTWLQQQM